MSAKREWIGRTRGWRIKGRTTDTGACTYICVLRWAAEWVSGVEGACNVWIVGAEDVGMIFSAVTSFGCGGKATDGVTERVKQAGRSAPCHVVGTLWVAEVG